MSKERIQDNLPKLYSKFYPELFEKEIPSESLSTCSNCTMLCKGDRYNKHLLTKSFSPNSKCCTFQPRLPNYLIGALLSDKTSNFVEGQNRVKKRILNKISVSPLGVYSSKKFDLLYEQSKSLSFGLNSTLICPYYEKESGNCTIWMYRETVCSTYFCKSVSGQSGYKFWESLKNLLFKIQINLSSYVIKVMELEFPLKYTGLSPEDVDDLPMSEENYKKMWKNWAGNEIEFYKKSFEIVNSLSKEDFETITEISQSDLFKELLINYEQMVVIPKLLKINPELKLEKTMNRGYKIHLKLIDLSFELPEKVIHAFDGNVSYTSIITYLFENEKIEIDDALIRTLYSYRILVPA